MPSATIPPPMFEVSSSELESSCGKPRIFNKVLILSLGIKFSKALRASLLSGFSTKSEIRSRKSEALRFLSSTPKAGTAYSSPANKFRSGLTYFSASSHRLQSGISFVSGLVLAPNITLSPGSNSSNGERLPIYS